MRVIINYIQGLWSKTELLVGAVFSFFWAFFIWITGGWDTQIQALCILAVSDYGTGVLAAFKTHSFASNIAAHGLCKKGVMFLIVGLGAVLDMAFGTHMVRTMFIGCFASIEAMSIVENIDRAGYGEYIPDFVRNSLAQVTQQKENPIIK